MPERLDATFVRREIDALAVTHPGIWEDDELRALALESETNLREFLEKVVRRMLEARASIGGIGQYICELKVRQDRMDQRVESMRALMFKLMQAAELKKLELAPATLSIRAGQPKVTITDETALPPDCVRIRTEPDRIAIKEQLMRGERMAGAELSNSEPTLAVRIK
jgi:Siphovirus Gp157